MTRDVRQKVYDAVYEGRIDNMTTKEVAVLLGITERAALHYLTEIVTGNVQDRRFEVVHGETTSITTGMRVKRRESGKQFVWFLV